VLVDLRFVPATKFADFEARRDQQGIGGPEDLAAGHLVLGADLVSVDAAARHRRRGHRGDQRHAYRIDPQMVEIGGDTLSRL
jgi:hypothetical protein